MFRLIVDSYISINVLRLNLGNMLHNFKICDFTGEKFDILESIRLGCTTEYHNTKCAIRKMTTQSVLLEKWTKFVNGYSITANTRS